MGKILDAYFLTGIIVTLLCFASGKHNSKLSDVEEQTTDKSYNQLQRLTDGDSLITTVEKPFRQHTDILATTSHKIPSKSHGNKSHKLRKEKLLANKEKQLLQKIRHYKNWLSRVVNKHGISKKVIRRKSRDDGTYEDEEDDENIQSKDEDKDEDVQLIIIPKKTRKHLRPKIQDEDENDGEEFQETVDTKEDSENNDRISENAESESQNSEDSEDSRKVSKKPYSVPSKFRHHRNYKKIPRKSKSADDDATLTLERVSSEDDDDDSKDNHESDSEDYDLHVKVKDKSGNHVKLSGDLPGNIGNLMAVGEDGGKVQIKNTGRHSKTGDDLKIVNSQGGKDDSTTDEMAKNLIKMKAGKLKHSPYPSTVLLKPDGGVNENPKLNSEENSNQTPVSLKTQESDGSQTLPANALTPLSRGEANAKAEQSANQQPSNNIFAPMEFENGDDELMATSRLLDIAQKADDVSSLKEDKDPPSTEKEQPRESLKDLTKGIAERQTSKAFLKSAPMNPEDYKKQSEDIDKESDDNWYKMQSLEDRIVNEGSSAKTGKDVGTSPPIVLSDQSVHGTQRHHFEIHDLTDVSGGKWKAVHIPDDDIASMLDVANQKQGANKSLDIQHEIPVSQEDEISDIQTPVEVHGRVHAFEHNLMKNESKNSTSSVGKLIVATENEHNGKEEGSLHPVHPAVINLRGYMKEEGPKNREIIHPKGDKSSVKPALVVAKIPEDDDGDDSDDLPLRKLPTPIVAPLRKTRPRIRPGSMRSDILATIIHRANKPRVLLTSPKPTASNNPKKSDVSQNASVSGNTKTVPQGKDDNEVLEKIKSLLLKSALSPKQPPAKIPTPTQNNIPSIQPAPQIEPVQPNKDGLFLPPKFSRPVDAFSNHDSVLNRISEPKREALLLGIIKALLARDKMKAFSGGRMMKGLGARLPHYDRQAVLQGLQNLQMSKTVASGQSDAAAPENQGPVNPPMPGKNLDEMYQKEREQEVKQELVRANEEALEAKKMRQEETEMVANYDRFLNPESRSNWGKIAGAGGPQKSQTPDGQVLSMLGPQQLNMLEDNPAAT